MSIFDNEFKEKPKTYKKKKPQSRLPKVYKEKTQNGRLYGKKLEEVKGKK